jgi:hypothetical protein
VAGRRREVRELVAVRAVAVPGQARIVAPGAYIRAGMPPDPDPAARIRTLLLRADNVLKNVVPGGDEDDRRRRAREALEEARTLATQPGVDERVAGLVDRRLSELDRVTAAEGDAG